MRIKDIDHFVIVTRDIRRCIDFYVTVLGMELDQRDGRYAVRFGRHKINIHEKPGEFQPAAANPVSGSADFCLVVDGDIEDVEAELRGRGMDLIGDGIVRRTGACGDIRSIYLNDPDGNLVELCSYGNRLEQTTSERRKMTSCKIIEIVDDRLLSRLVDIWESAVSATHDFLEPGDITAIREQVAEAIPSMDLLMTAEIDGQAVGFIACCAAKIEMLFVHDDYRGQGIGRRLITEVMSHRPVTHVDVNEQNPQGVGFYSRLGFAVESRSDHDEQGNPFPILHLVWRGDAGS